MGQSLDSMTQNQSSKEELLYQLVLTGNVEAIRALCSEGAGLEWIDKEGKTPLIVACMDSGLFNVAKALIELGANVNAYRPGRHAGTPLHHAAKRGLERTVNLLLFSGANALVRNDDCQTALDVARIKGHVHVVRAIESHICYFSGWLREFYGPGFLEALAPQFLSRKIWAVVIPCGSSNPLKPQKLQLLVYPTVQDVQPRTVIALWKAKIEEPKFDQSDPGLIIFDQSTRTRYKFASENVGDKLQLHRLYDACRGTPPPGRVSQSGVQVIGHEASSEAVELAMAISASIQSAADDRPPIPDTQQSAGEIDANGWENSVHSESYNGWGLAVGSSPPVPPIPGTRQSSENISANGWEISEHGESHNGWGPPFGSSHSVASSSRWTDEAAKEDDNGWGVPNSGPVRSPGQGHLRNPDVTSPIVPVIGGTSQVSSAPSAPPIPDDSLDEGPIHYPSIDFSPVEFSVPALEQPPMTTDGNDGGGSASSSCIICWEAPVEGACIPCGHMAGCVACLNEIKAKKGVCPVCRATINQVVRLYAV